MTTPVIIDIVIAAALAGFAIYGAARGLIRALAGLAVVIVALAGAGMIARALSGPAAELVTPLIEAQIRRQVEGAMATDPGAVEMPEADVEAGVTAGDILSLLGLDEETAASLAERAEETVRDTGISIALAVAESVAHSIIYALLYLVSFLALSLLLRLVLRAVDLVARLPVLHQLNTLGGGAVGLIEGMLLVFLSIWILRRLGVSFETQTAQATYLLKFFAAHTPLSALSLLE